LYQNHGLFMFPHKSYRTMEAEFNALNKRTYAYWVAHIRIVKRRRVFLTDGTLIGLVSEVVEQNVVINNVQNFSDESVTISTVADDSSVDSSGAEESVPVADAVQNSIAQVNE